MILEEDKMLSSSLSVGGGNAPKVASDCPTKPKAEEDDTTMAAPACQAWI